MMKKYVIIFVSLLFSCYSFAQINPDTLAIPNVLIKPTAVTWQEEDTFGNPRTHTYTIRASRILLGNREKLYAILTDFENYDKWMPYFNSTKKETNDYLNFSFRVKALGTYHLSLKILPPRQNVNGQYHLIRIAADKEFSYSTIKAMEHHFYLYPVEDVLRKTIDENYTLLEFVNHTKVGDLLSLVPEEKIKEVLREVAEDIFKNLQIKMSEIR